MHNTFEKIFNEISNSLFTVEIREIKEIRVGSNTKDFEKLSEDTRRKENLKCFSIYYGSEFRLKTLSLMGKWLNKINLFDIILVFCNLIQT